MLKIKCCLVVLVWMLCSLHPDGGWTGLNSSFPDKSCLHEKSCSYLFMCLFIGPSKCGSQMNEVPTSDKWQVDCTRTTLNECNIHTPPHTPPSLKKSSLQRHQFECRHLSLAQQVGYFKNTKRHNHTKQTAAYIWFPWKWLKICSALLLHFVWMTFCRCSCLFQQLYSVFLRAVSWINWKEGDQNQTHFVEFFFSSAFKSPTLMLTILVSLFWFLRPTHTYALQGRPASASMDSKWGWRSAQK